MERELKPKKGRFQVSAKEERTSHGIVFASKLELRLFLWLKKRLPDEPIRLQEKFILQEGFRGPHENRHRPILYVTDFTLGPKRSSADAPVPVGMLVIDAKGMETTDFRMKRKMFEYRYGVPLWTPGSEGQLEVIIQHYKNIMKNNKKIESHIKILKTESKRPNHVPPPQYFFFVRNFCGHRNFYYFFFSTNN